ncbi:hypothetical protein Tco_1147946 [Tanacetum coccineum]
METCTKLSERVLALENTKTAQDLKIAHLKKRVKKLEKKKKSRTPQPMKRKLFKIRVESSEIFKEPIVLVEDKGSAEKGDSTVELVSSGGETVTAAGVNPEVVSTAGVYAVLVDTSVDITLAETLVEIKKSSSQPQKLKGIEFKEPSGPITAPRSQPRIDPKDKELERMQKERVAQEEASRAAINNKLDSIQAMIEAGQLLAARLQAKQR